MNKKKHSILQNPKLYATKPISKLGHTWRDSMAVWTAQGQALKEITRSRKITKI